MRTRLLNMLLWISMMSVVAIPHIFAVTRFWTTDEVITNQEIDAVGAEIRDSTDTLRDGTELIAEGIGDADNNDKIYFSEVTSTEQSRSKTADYVRALVNYALAIIGLVALLYIAYHGFLTLTAAGDDEKSAKWIEWMRYGAMALIGIAVAWFFLSLVFWLIQQIT